MSEQLVIELSDGTRYTSKALLILDGPNTGMLLLETPGWIGPFIIKPASARTFCEQVLVLLNSR